MGPVQQAVRMQDFQVVANRNLRSLELPGQIDDQDAAVAIQRFNNCASAFFIQQMSTEAPGQLTPSIFLSIAFYNVFFRLSRVQAKLAAFIVGFLPPARGPAPFDQRRAAVLRGENKGPVGKPGIEFRPGKAHRFSNPLY